MQFWDFLHKNCIPIRKKFVRHRLQIRSFQEVKIFKYTFSERKDSKSLSTVFRDGSRTDTKSKMDHFSYIFLNINSWHMAYTIALKTGTYFGKKRDFLQGCCYVNRFKGAHWYAYFLKPHIILYFRASFQLFSNILTSFRRGDFIPTRIQITEILTQIRQSFLQTQIKIFYRKTFRFHLCSGLRSWKKQFIWDFLFSKPVNLGTSVRKTNRRSRNKQRPKKLQRKHYCSTSRKVLHEALGLCLKLAFLKHKVTVLSISTSLNVK